MSGSEGAHGRGPAFGRAQAEPGAPAPRPTRSKKRLALAGLLVVILIAALGSWAFHLLNQRPLLQVVPIPTSSGLGAIAARFEGSLVMGAAQGATPRVTPDGKKAPPLTEIRGLGIGWDGARIYAADPGSGVVTAFDRSGNPLKIVGADGKGRLRGPTAVAEAPDGRIFVVDRLDNRLAIFDHNGIYIEDFRPANMPSSFPLVPISLAFGKDGALYLGDGNGPVYVFDKEKNLQRRMAPPDGLFQAAWGLSVNSSGQVAVTDSSHQRVFVFKADGALQSTLGGGGSGPGSLSLPRGVGMDDRGRVFVSDTFSQRVQVYSADGAYLGYFGREGDLDGQFSFPEGVVLGEGGALYIADRGNKRIQAWRY